MRDTSLLGIGIQGGPGDDGSGTVLTGNINFDAGTDGLKSIEITPPAVALSGIYVDSDGVGTTYLIQTQWQAGRDATGAFAPGFEQGGTLVGYMAVPGVGNVGAYTVEVENDGSYTFTLLSPLAHPDQDDGDDGNGVETSWEDNLLVEFGIEVTDGDDDVAEGTLTVNVDDDSPDAGLVTVSFDGAGDGAIIHDETAGEDAGSDDQPLGSLPGSLGAYGAAIGWAQSAIDVDTTNGTGNPSAAFGADGSSAKNVSLTASGGGGFDGDATNLFDTETGNRIFLYTDGDIVIGPRRHRGNHRRR